MWYRLPMVGLMAILPALLGTPARAQQIVLSPRTGIGGAPDFWNLFTQDAPWAIVASRITSIELGSGDFGSTAQLRSMGTFLHSRKIRLGVGLLPLTSENWDVCGRGVEGYSARSQPLANAMRLRSAGLRPAYFGMDEPLWFGHFYDGPHACHSSINEVVKEVAKKVRQVNSIFPQAQIGEVEPISALWRVRPDRWASEIQEWLAEYHAATGHKLAFFRLDMEWNHGWQTQIGELTDILRRAGVPLQIIYNSGSHTDKEWTARAESHFKEFESGPWPLPAAAVFQSWTSNPSHLLPETEPTTLTGLVRRYIEWKAPRAH